MTDDVFDAGELANEFRSIEGYACDALMDIVVLFVPSSVRNIGTRGW